MDYLNLIKNEEINITDVPDYCITKNIKKAAIKIDPLSEFYFEKQTEEICYIKVRYNSFYLQYV